MHHFRGEVRIPPKKKIKKNWILEVMQELPADLQLVVSCWQKKKEKKKSDQLSDLAAEN